jgi:hypothetical protein
MSIIHKYSVTISQNSQSVFIKKTNQLMLYRERVFVGENITKTYTDTYTVRAERRISESHGK